MQKQNKPFWRAMNFKESGFKSNIGGINFIKIK